MIYIPQFVEHVDSIRTLLKLIETDNRRIVTFVNWKFIEKKWEYRCKLKNIHQISYEKCRELIPVDKVISMLSCLLHAHIHVTWFEFEDYEWSIYPYCRILLTGKELRNNNFEGNLAKIDNFQGITSEIEELNHWEEF
jgi:hypothetical protein